MSTGIEQVIPPGKATGCLPRKSYPGQWCPMAAERIEIVPRSEWAALAKEISLRPFVKTVLDQDGVGCHDDQTEVLTGDGWQRWDAYQGDAPLATVCPTSLTVEFQYPTALHAYEYDGPLCHVEHRSTNFAVTPNHRMFVRRWNERERRLNAFYEFRPADNVGWWAGMLAAPLGFVGAELDQLTIGARQYSGDDLMALTALVASDGWAGGSESTRNRVSFCCFREDRLPFVKPFAERLGWRVDREGVWTTRDAPLADWMRANLYTADGLGALNKRVPLLVKCASRRQIERFLDFFGDQHIQNHRRAFYTSSRQMADDLQELLLMCGRRAGICKHKPRDATFRGGRQIEAANGNSSFTVTEWTSDSLAIEQKKVGLEHYRGLVYCATVPNSTLITRRDGKVLISGNSCATEATAGAAMISRAFGNLPHVILNPWFIYYTTSGGRDQGSSIDENLVFARERGIAPESVWPRSKGWRTKPSDEAVEAAKEFRIVEFYDVTTIDEMVSCLLKGFPVVYGSNGHAVTKVQHIDESKGLDLNSWGASWGDKGFGVWATYRQVNWAYGAWAVRTTTETK